MSKSVEGGAKKIRTASEIRSAAAGTVTSLKAEMKKTGKALGEAIVGEATERLMAEAEDKTSDGPYNAKGEAKVSLKLADFEQGAQVMEWLESSKSLPVQVAPILEELVKETFQKAAELEVAGYTLKQSRTNDYFEKPISGSWNLTVTIKDPVIETDPVLSGS